MNAFRRWLVVVLAALGVLSFTATARAQAARTWVSGVGNDVNPCTRTAPCRMFAAALLRTPVGGEIDVLDDGAYGTVTITKSVTIDARGKVASIYNAAATGITINDANAVVTLRGLSIGGAGSGMQGIKILAAKVVSIEDSVVSGQMQQAINVTTTSPSSVNIRNTVVRNNGAAGIAVGTGSSVMVDGCSLVNNLFGLAVSTGSSVFVVGSTFFANTTSGVEADAGAQMSVTRSVISANATGVQSNGTIRLSDCDITGNITGFTGGGAVTYGNNRIAGNGAAGTVPTAASPALQ